MTSMELWLTNLMAFTCLCGFTLYVIGLSF